MMPMMSSQFVGLRPTMGGSVILTHEGVRAVRAEGRVRLWGGRVMRVVGGWVMVREVMGRRWVYDRKIVRRRMVGWTDGLGAFERRVQVVSAVSRLRKIESKAQNIMLYTAGSNAIRSEGHMDACMALLPPIDVAH